MMQNAGGTAVSRSGNGKDVYRVVFFPETNEDMLICYRRTMKVFFSIPCRGFGTYYVDERLCGRRNLERIFYSTKKGSQQYLVTRTKYARVILVIANDHMPERSWSFEDIKSDKKGD